MDNSTVIECPPPFLSEASFPPKGGYIAGRYCAKLDITLYQSCCLPCPQTDWVYSDSFPHANTAVNWIAVVSLICSVFLLASSALLSAEQSRRYYITTCVLVSIMIMTLSFVIPLGAQPDQCFDAITPNDMHSNLACAWSGALLLGGGFCCIMWILMCALNLHLQICWKVVAARKFCIMAHLLGWGVPAIILIESLSFGGVSYRFSSTCVSNHRDAIPGVWVPALILAVATVLVQFATIGYCTKVYFQCHASGNGSLSHLLSASTGSQSGTTMALDPGLARQAYSRVKGLVKMQWRGFVMVLIIITDVIIFCICFLIMDHTSSLSDAEVAASEPWLICLALKGKDQCYGLTKNIVLPEGTMVFCMVLLCFNGIWAFLLLTHVTTFTGWSEVYHKIAARFVRPSREDADRWNFAARTRQADARARVYDTLKSPTPDSIPSSGPSKLYIPRHRSESIASSRRPSSPYSPGEGLSQFLPLSPLRQHLNEKPLPPLPV
ncbi:MAG: hypothetical protein M1838_003618 [Thelocarpon superellum]|nr:MAG: hypothetical protein M1838_003618 [Thelocarpon superellum]